MTEYNVTTMDDDFFWPNYGPLMKTIDVLGPEKFYRPIGFLADIHTDLEWHRRHPPNPLTTLVTAGHLSPTREGICTSEHKA